MLKEYLKENNLIIVPNSIKKKIIKEMNSYSLTNYKVMDIKEFLNNYFYSYDKKTINYCLNKYNLKYDITLEYLDILNYLEDKEYNTYKLNYLVNLKKDLLDNKLLVENKLFKYYLSNTNIIVIGYDLDPFYIDILCKYNYQVVDNTPLIKELKVYEFNYIDDEISFVCNDILNKIHDGIDINKIKLISSSEYSLVLNRIFNWYHIPLDNNTKISLYDLEIGKKIISMIDDNKSFEEIIEELKSNNTSDDLINKIINIFNTYVDITDLNKEIIIHDLKNTYLKQTHIANSIRLINLEELEDDEIGYLIGFNKENYPVLHKDDELLSDNMKKELKLSTSNDNNISERNRLINNINNSNNLIITYKTNDSTSNYSPSLIIELENMEVISNPKIEYNKSNIYNKISLAANYDNYNKYGILSDELKLLKSNYSDINYNTYTNIYTGIDVDKYLTSIKLLNLSYTSLDSYFKCSFAYYLNRVLKIYDEYSDTFFRDIGTIFHYVLSKYREDDFDFDKCFDEKVKEYNFTLDKFLLLNRLKEELRFDIEIIRKQENYTKFNKFMFEKEINFPIENSKNVKVNFTGTVDKIMYEEDNNQTYLSVIDYKTGTPDISLNNLKYGLDMQLPIYLYLVKRSDLFTNINIAGFYLQFIINKDIKETLDESNIDNKVNLLKLQGYSNSDIDILSRFDMTYNNSALIKSMKINKDGSFSHYAKILTDEEMNDIDNIVSSKIEEGTNLILDAKFDINPKKDGKELVSCKFCPYIDICFRTRNDIIEITKDDDLGGEE